MTAATPEGRRPETEATTPTGRRPADTFSNRLLLTIRLTGLSIRDFADGAGLDDGSVSNWTRGMRPREFPEVCHAIAEAYDIDLMWLMQGGALQSAKGMPTKSRGDLNRRYVPVPRTVTARWRNGRPSTGTSATAVQRPQIIDRSLPMAA